GGRDLDRDSRRRDRHRGLLVELLLELPVGPPAVDLDEVGMGERVEETGARGCRELVEVPLPSGVDTDRIDQTRLPVHAEAFDEVDRPEQVVPRVRLEQHTGLLLPCLGAPEVHVGVGDQSSAATRSRSAPSVTLISLGSPGTTLTRPPRASTREAQSLAAPVSPA